MKLTKICSGVVLVVSAVYVSQVNATSNLLNGEVKPITVKNSILKTIDKNESKLDGQWISYQVEMEPSNGMPCCFRGSDQIGCNLEKRSNVWGTHHNEEDSKVLHLYFKWQDNQPSDIFYAGSECPVDASDNKVFSLTGISQKQSVQFLSKYINSANADKVQKRAARRALSGVAMHKGKFAHNYLDKLANQSDDKISREAIFWLGEARNKAGYESLVDILDDDDRSIKVREKAVFALSENQYKKSAEKLVELALAAKEPKIQAKAIFWLADSNHPKTIEVVDEILSSDAGERVKKKAVFALSELDTDKSWQKLVQIAKRKDNSEVRRQAIFWLSQNENRDAKSVLLSIINDANQESIKVKAVFGLSQLNEKDATDGLLEVLKSADSRRVRKKALFWLGQSDDPRALKALEDILTASID